MRPGESVGKGRRTNVNILKGFFTLLQNTTNSLREILVLLFLILKSEARRIKSELSNGDSWGEERGTRLVKLRALGSPSNNAIDLGLIIGKTGKSYSKGEDISTCMGCYNLPCLVRRRSC